MKSGERGMPTMKLTLVTMAALLLGSVSASAITVKKRIEAPGLPPQIWEIVGSFCAIKTWHPAVADCVEGKEGDVVFRTLTLKDGLKLKEKLTGTDDLAYTIRDRRGAASSQELQVQALVGVRPRSGSLDNLLAVRFRCQWCERRRSQAEDHHDPRRRRQGY